MTEDVTKGKKVRKDYTSKERSIALLHRLAQSGGKRIAVDLDPKSKQCLDFLLDKGYAKNQVSIIRRALIDAAKSQENS